MSIVPHRRRGTHIDRDPKSELLRPHFQGTKSSCLFDQTLGRNHARRSARTLLINLPMPLEQLLLEIFLVRESVAP